MKINIAKANIDKPNLMIEAYKNTKVKLNRNFIEKEYFQHPDQPSSDDIEIKNDNVDSKL